jgi:hypothetical protein
MLSIRLHKDVPKPWPRPELHMLYAVTLYVWRKLYRRDITTSRSSIMPFSFREQIESFHDWYSHNTYFIKGKNLEPFTVHSYQEPRNDQARNQGRARTGVPWEKNPFTTSILKIRYITLSQFALPISIVGNLNWLSMCCMNSQHKRTTTSWSVPSPPTATTASAPSSIAYSTYSLHLGIFDVWFLLTRFT